MIGHSSDLKSPHESGQTAGADMISNEPRVCCVCNWKTVIRSWEGSCRTLTSALLKSLEL